jgi:hypothetical protein
VSDNFGPEQPVVRNPDNKNWDQVVFQHKKPALSSEWNLAGQISEQKSQSVSKSFAASGWLNVGSVRYSDNSASLSMAAKAGDVLTSSDYIPNTFVLSAKGEQNVALVNGWNIKVQGTNSLSLDNEITLSKNRLCFSRSMERAHR